MSRSSRRRAQRSKVAAHVAAGTYVPRIARASKGTTSAASSTAPRAFVEGYEQRESSDPTTAREIERVINDYCAADKLEDPSIGHAT